MPSKKNHIQLYADQCFPIPSVTHLKSLGYSVIHANDLKLEGKSDRQQLHESKKLNRILITLDRDFIYYEQVNLEHHPGVIIISVGSAVSTQVNKVCTKLLKSINQEFVKESLIKVSVDKLTKVKERKVVHEKEL